jgi:predicted PurR-regulated permease PerM
MRLPHPFPPLVRSPFVEAASRRRGELRLPSRYLREDVVFLRRVLIVAAVVVLALFLWAVSDVLLLVFGSVVVAALLRLIAVPIGQYTGMKDGLALAIATVVIAGLIALAVYLFGSEILAQARELAKSLPQAWSAFEDRIGAVNLDERVMEQASSGYTDLVTRAAGILYSVGNSLVVLALVIAGGLYIAATPNLYSQGLLELLPDSQRERVAETFTAAGRALRLWLLGQLLAMAIVGALTTMGVLFIGLPSPLALGLLAGLAEFIPLLGPIAAAVPALLLAMNGGWELLLWTAAVYLVVQQVESNVISPLVQARTVELPPAVLLFAVLAAGTVFGPLGVLLAAPLTVVCYVAVKMLYVRDTLGEETTVPGEDAAAK